MGITHIKDGQGFFDGGHAKMHRDFGFSGSTSQQPRGGRADGGQARGPQVPPRAPFPIEPTSMPRQLDSQQDGGVRMARGGHVDEAQDKALIKKMLKQHEASEGEPVKKARGGRARLPTGMKATALQKHSPINTPPRNPTRTTTPRNIMPGGQMAYGVQPSSEPAVAGSEQGIPQLKDGGRVRMGADRGNY